MNATTPHPSFCWARLLLVAAVVFGLTACRHPPIVSPPDLQLDQGRKWVIPPTMMVYLRDLERDVHDFEAALVQDHPALAAAIQNHLVLLVTHCTLTGPGHDELHQWLLPFLDVSRGYVNATTRPAQEEHYREIQRALKVFHQYFE